MQASKERSLAQPVYYAVAVPDAARLWLDMGLIEQFFRINSDSKLTAEGLAATLSVGHVTSGEEGEGGHVTWGEEGAPYLRGHVTPPPEETGAGKRADARSRSGVLFLTSRYTSANQGAATAATLVFAHGANTIVKRSLVRQGPPFKSSRSQTTTVTSQLPSTVLHRGDARRSSGAVPFLRWPLPPEQVLSGGAPSLLFLLEARTPGPSLRDSTPPKPFPRPEPQGPDASAQGCRRRLPDVLKDYFINSFELGSSPGGLVQAGDDNILLEIKCPYRYCDKPICDKEGNLSVDYLHFVNGKLLLKESHSYYTQVQVSLYVLNLTACHFFVYSPLQVKNITVKRDDNFLMSLISKMEWFYFKFYKSEVMKGSS
ncbi:hypothetical protein HPB47_013888 [Ixodes persulcatus]|uniref:Uncharacterized protein n=1 Tax=Ixodes persulcatus TaxID=34615 RepID=A0AC60QXC6_IXOPE|nr:hypothetical protein HPB47_013888 [Ixodes persulcatus]